LRAQRNFAATSRHDCKGLQVARLDLGGGEAFLRKLVRDPASVRNWEQRIMPGFAPSALSDAKLEDLLAYLRQMAKQR
jgi:hypothetical protein